jgi:hypothetical protein
MGFVTSMTGFSRQIRDAGCAQRVRGHAALDRQDN